ncbi:ABC-three component system middle component 1 [Neobacillus drentensis]|uniref:ABC-three component system middle component 1 n=1 Tax=Neobacillus drentensis TaxID=220684 RepID=UPI002FFF583B
MKLIKIENIHEILESYDEETFKINCFQYPSDQGSYNFYLFTSYCNTESELERNYQSLNDIIAFEFQRKLLLDIEKWNLYIFFFVKEDISEELKVQIEQDKYATRKIVYKHLGKEPSEEEQKDIIFDKLFRLNIRTSPSSKTEVKSKLSELIKEEDPYLLKLIMEVKGISDDNQRKLRTKGLPYIQSYLEVKKNVSKN